MTQEKLPVSQSVRDAERERLRGCTLEQDIDGDWVLRPPITVTIFTVPGEGWLVTRDYMQGRDWDSRSDVLSACEEYLSTIPALAPEAQHHD